MASVVFENASRIYPGTTKPAVDKLNLTVNDGEFLVLVGPSGCGKSTFIRCINRLHEVVPHTKVSGEVLLDGKDIYSADVDPMEIDVFVVFPQGTMLSSYTQTLYERNSQVKWGRMNDRQVAED